jgi:hypothetical protein
MYVRSIYKNKLISFFQFCGFQKLCNSFHLKKGIQSNSQKKTKIPIFFQFFSWASGENSYYTKTPLGVPVNQEYWTPVDLVTTVPYSFSFFGMDNAAPQPSGSLCVQVGNCMLRSSHQERAFWSLVADFLSDYSKGVFPWSFTYPLLFVLTSDSNMGFLVLRKMLKHWLTILVDISLLWSPAYSWFFVLTSDSNSLVGVFGSS